MTVKAHIFVDTLEGVSVCSFEDPICGVLNLGYDNALFFDDLEMLGLFIDKITKQYKSIKRHEESNHE